MAANSGNKITSITTTLTPTPNVGFHFLPPLLFKRDSSLRQCINVSYQYLLKVVGNEMNGGSDTCRLNSFWYGTHVIGVCLSFNGGIVF